METRGRNDVSCKKPVCHFLQFWIVLWDNGKMLYSMFGCEKSQSLMIDSPLACQNEQFCFLNHFYPRSRSMSLSNLHHSLFIKCLTKCLFEFAQVFDRFEGKLLEFIFGSVVVVLLANNSEDMLNCNCGRIV